MHTFAFDGIVGHQGILLFKALFVCQLCFVFQGRELRCDIGEYEESGVLYIATNQVYALVSQIHAVHFLFDNEVQRVSHLVHALVVLLHVDFFGLQHTGLDALFAEELDECLVLGQALVTAVQSEEAFFLVFLIVRCNQALGIGQVLGSQFFLSFYQTFHLRAELFEELVIAFGNRSGDNQRSTGIINQY